MLAFPCYNNQKPQTHNPHGPNSARVCLHVCVRKAGIPQGAHVLGPASACDHAICVRVCLGEGGDVSLHAWSVIVSASPMQEIWRIKESSGVSKGVLVSMITA